MKTVTKKTLSQFNFTNVKSHCVNKGTFKCKSCLGLFCSVKKLYHIESHYTIRNTLFTIFQYALYLHRYMR